MSSNNQTVLVMGAGSWGTALALHLARNYCQVYLWSYEREHVAQMQKHQKNERFVPDCFFPANLIPCQNWSDVIKECDHILIAVPSHAFEDVLHQLAPFINHQGILWATKGLCHRTCRFLHEIVFDKLGPQCSAGILTGPSFAKEVAHALPTAVVIASYDYDYAYTMQQTYNAPTFRTYITDDLIGAQIGGAVKNALAIATGVSDGLGFGANARAGLITRGLAEMVRLGKAMGAQESTLMGLSGVGDLILTCTDDKSRNRRFGLAMGQGDTQQNAIQTIGQVVEGVAATSAVNQLAQSYQVTMPIVDQIHKMLYHDISAYQAFQNLMERQLKEESA